jgi:hypothetical protein
MILKAAPGQCLARDALAAQTINGDASILLQGAVSNGEVWQFAQLQGRQSCGERTPFYNSGFGEPVCRTPRRL